MIAEKSIFNRLAKIERRRLVDYIIISALIGLAIYICFYQLGASYFENWDEAFYAQMTKEMLRSKDWITVHWNYQLFLDKTPFNFWLNCFWAKLIGLSELSVRLTSAISGFIVIVIILLLSYRRFGLVPSLFAFSAVALNNVYIWRTRTGNLDALLSLMILLVYLLMISRFRFRYLLLGILFGLIYLQKSSVVVFPLAGFIIYEFLDYRSWLKNLVNYFFMFLLLVLIVGGWLKLGEKQAGKEFLRYYLYRADQGVSQVKLEFFKRDYWDYTYYSLQRRLIYPFIVGLVFLLIRFRERKNLALLYFSLTLLLLLSFTERKNNWYLVPSMPFWGLTVGYGVREVLVLVDKIKLRRITALGLIGLLAYVSYKTLTVNIMAIIKTRASIAEVTTALRLKQLVSPDEIILRLDHLYPTTIYYSDRKTLFYTTDDQGLYETINKYKIRWLAGKKEVIDNFFEKNQSVYQLQKIEVGDEAILRIDYQ